MIICQEEHCIIIPDIRYSLQQFEQITQHTHSGDCSASASSLYNQGSWTVPLRMEHDYIVRTPQRGGKWMRDRVPSIDISTSDATEESDNGTYFSSPAFTSPLTPSTTPTNLRTFPSALASLRILSKSASNSGSLFKNSSPVGMPSSAAGMSDAVSTDLKDCKEGSDEEPIVRERIVSLRATSKPLRSSAGWGSW